MSWLQTTMGEVCLPTLQKDPTRNGTGSFRYIDISGIDRETKTISGAGYVPCAEAPSRARKLVQTGDLLVSTVRPNLNAVAIVPEELDGEIASTGFCVLRANRRLAVPSYLLYRVRHQEFVDFLVANATGATYPAVSDGVVRRAPLPLPSLSEQAHIVELLDEADRLRRLCREADAKAARILSALFLRMFGAPETWVNTRNLGQIVHMKSGGTPSKSVPEYWVGPTPWVSPKDMKSDVIEDAEDHISESAVQSSATQVVPEGSILIVVRGMILARDVPLAITRARVAINQDMKALMLTDDRLTPLFLFAVLKALAARLLREVTTAAHGTKKLETNRLESLPIPLPSGERIARFTAVYEALSVIDRKRSALALRIDHLFSLLLSRAFSGQLTAKWREAQMRELLAEMQEQARLLRLEAVR